MKAVNLLRSSLDAAVSCDKCMVDGYAVANLISEDIIIRQKGTLMEHFIRPPVNIDFTLPCPSDIGFIKVKLARASTVIQRLQVWSQSAGQDHWVKLTTAFDAGNQLVLKCGQILPPHLIVDNLPAQSTLQIVRMLRNTVKLRVTVLAMKNCVAVGLAGCEAYGVPSRHLPKTHPIFSKLNEKPGHPSNNQSASSSTTSSLRMNLDLPRKLPEKGDILRNTARKRQFHESTSCSSDDSIPEDFLDAITVTLMTMPVLLPSGNIVDQSTLDKYVAIENRWGRPASDPFTGVPLRSRPPVLTELKSRIDHFLSNSGSTSGTRLADGRNVAHSEVSRLIQQAPSETANAEPVRAKGVSSSEPPTSITLSTDLKTAFAQALETARRVLNGTPSGQEDGGTSKRIKPSCSNCSSSESNYKLLCGHLLCRSCVVVEATAKCGTCGKESLRAEIVKINLL